MYKFKCEHGHSGLEHTACFERNNIDLRKMGYFDIEATQLKADFGFILSWYIKEKGKEVYQKGTVTRESILSGELDKSSIREMVNAIKEYDCIVTYYGSMFDIPYGRTRALMQGLSFIPPRIVKHIDLYWTVKTKFKFFNNKLETACRNFGIEGKTHINPKLWIMASCGSEPAIEEVLEHNYQDVKILELLHEKIGEFVNPVEKFI